MDWLKYLIDCGITGLLVLLSLISLAIFVERYLFMKKLKVEEYGGRKTLEIEVTRGLMIVATIRWERTLRRAARIGPCARAGGCGRLCQSCGQAF